MFKSTTFEREIFRHLKWHAVQKIALFSNDFQVEENTSLPAYESSSDRIKKKKTFCLSFVSQILDASLLHTAPQQKE